MAQPLRWVLIGLSVRLGKSIYEVETWEIPVIRQYMAYLMKDAEPSRQEVSRQQTPEEIQAAFEAAFSRK